MNALSYVSGARGVRQWAVERRSLVGFLYLLANQLAAAAILLALSPVMLVVAWRIWRTDGAPIFFNHYRVGLDGRLFRCMKFRSMRIDADKVLANLLASDPDAREAWERDQKLLDDPRITKIGVAIRKSSLDELPQLFNVLRGDMVLVGPRPITVSELARYGDSRWHYLTVRPGMTGLWQVSGRNHTTYEERVHLDRTYVEERTPWMDILILLRTIRVVVTGHGAS